MVRIDDPFWNMRRELNRKVALNYQWEQYECCGTLENFRLIAESRSGKREGYFYTDSDLHKWADAASRALASGRDPLLEERLDEYISLMEKAQDRSGYLFTWNQIYFPQVRWKNIQIEHELYTAGHFIEAGVSHYEATGNNRLLRLARKAADGIVRDFLSGYSSQTPGHQELEIAMIRLYRCTGERKYLAQARALLENRGRNRFFFFTMLKEVISHSFRNNSVKRRDRIKGSKELGFEFGENVQDREPPFIMLRSLKSFADGSYLQQHKPLKEQSEPKGHAVRWAYMMHGAAMLANESDDVSYEEFLYKSWKNLIEKKMYITGGIGSLPIIEGFGKEYELDNEFSYSETCAAIGSIFWNNEMLKLIPRAEFADLIERQLYNGASVGISEDGKKYFYRNPLESRGELERQSWFATACCPSNISRLWADIDKLAFLEKEKDIYINQYLGCSADLLDGKVSISMKSEFPFEGKVLLNIRSSEDLNLMVRVPGWTGEWEILLNSSVASTGNREMTSSLYTDIMKNGHYERLQLSAGEENLLELKFPMEIRENRSSDKIKGNRRKAAVTRGPLVYCVESDQDIENLLDCSTLSFNSENGTIGNNDITLIPYFKWGNEGKKKMKVWLPLKQ